VPRWEQLAAVGATQPDSGGPEIEPDVTGKITSLDGD